MDVVLVVPPFFDVNRPALGLSLLAALLPSCEVLYPNLRWAEQVGLPLYGWFAGDDDGSEDWLAAALSAILATHDLRSAYVDAVVDDIVARSPRVVGFTTTLASLTAGLAIARRLRLRAPHLVIVFGGAAVEGSMGHQLLRSYDCVDHVCTGEGEAALPALVRALLAGAVVDVPGIASRGSAPTTAATVVLETQPIPAYDDYFRAVATSALALRPRLPVETSRGCWWGQKQHCTYLTLADVRALAAGGVTNIQSGIESLDTGTLRLMKKGTTAGQNVALLRWCAEVGMNVPWNLLYGFPGEDRSAFARTAALIPLLEHLQPPAGCTPIRLARYSPLFDQRPGIVDVKPLAAMDWTSGLDDDALAETAAFFSFGYADGRDPLVDARELDASVRGWRQGELTVLHAMATPRGIAIQDTRRVALRPFQLVSGMAARVLEACDRPRSTAALVRELGPAAADSVAQLIAARLVVDLDGMNLALPVWVRRPAVAEGGVDRVAGVARYIGAPPGNPRCATRPGPR